jgi:hypothetical protein
MENVAAGYRAVALLPVVNPDRRLFVRRLTETLSALVRRPYCSVGQYGLPRQNKIGCQQPTILFGTI